MPDPQEGSAPRTIGWRIRRLRDRAGLRQAEVAAKVDLSRASISNIEGDRQEPTLTTLVTMADLFGVTVGVLAGAEPMPVLQPEVRIRASFAVTCEECGEVGEFRDHGQADRERKRHLREDHRHV